MAWAENIIISHSIFEETDANVVFLALQFFRCLFDRDQSDLIEVLLRLMFSSILSLNNGKMSFFSPQAEVTYGPCSGPKWKEKFPS